MPSLLRSARPLFWFALAVTSLWALVTAMLPQAASLVPAGLFLVVMLILWEVLRLVSDGGDMSLRDGGAAGQQYLAR